MHGAPLLPNVDVLTERPVAAIQYSDTLWHVTRWVWQLYYNIGLYYYVPRVIMRTSKNVFLSRAVILFLVWMFHATQHMEEYILSSVPPRQNTTLCQLSHLAIPPKIPGCSPYIPCTILVSQNRRSIEHLENVLFFSTFMSVRPYLRSEYLIWDNTCVSRVWP